MEKDVLPSVTNDPSKKLDKKILFILFRKAPNSILGQLSSFLYVQILKTIWFWIKIKIKIMCRLIDK